MDKTALRATFGRFATGVTIVSCEREGQVHGMTANSFTSVSLDPALVLISLGNNTRMAKLLGESGDFGLTILSAAQEGLSNHFSGRPGAEPIAFTRTHGVPMIAGALAGLVCRLRDVWPAGDHSLFVGEVLHHEQGGEDMPPLLFYRGRYRQIDQAFA